VKLGIAWLTITVLFELAFGHWVAGHPWSRLLADYNILAGRLWVFVLLTTALAPWLMGRMRRLGSVPGSWPRPFEFAAWGLVAFEG
jgi:hypothetical protein